MQLPVADVYDSRFAPAGVRLACGGRSPASCSCPCTSPSGGTWSAFRLGWSASRAIRQADIAASEALLDRAETELEALFGPERGAER